MKFRDYAIYIARLAENRDYDNLEVVSSSDEEGNSFSGVFFMPTVGVYDKENGAFTDECDHRDINAICIN